MDLLRDINILTGRLCLSLLYLWVSIEQTIYLRATSAMMVHKNVANTWLIFPFAILLQLLGGFSLPIGYKTILGATSFLVFTFAAAVKFHDFWNQEKELRSY